MKQVAIEGSGIRVSRLALGTGSLHHAFRFSQRQRLLSVAASAGITHFDTSPYYGYGLAESDLGSFLRRQRSEFTVATKVGMYPWGKAVEHSTSVWMRKVVGGMVPAVSRPVIDWRVDRARLSLQQSLRRLGTDYIDFLFLHEPDQHLIDADEYQRWIEDEVARGAVRTWGLAGVAEKVAPWVQGAHCLSRVVQTRDSLDKRQADFMLAAGRPLQFTYGYLSAHSTLDKRAAPETVLRGALVRNSCGAVIFSTRRAERIPRLVGLAG